MRKHTSSHTLFLPLMLDVPPHGVCLPVPPPFERPRGRTGGIYPRRSHTSEEYDVRLLRGASHFPLKTRIASCVRPVASHCACSSPLFFILPLNDILCTVHHGREDNRFVTVSTSCSFMCRLPSYALGRVLAGTASVVWSRPLLLLTTLNGGISHVMLL